MKHWFAATLAALLVVIAGTAIASVPSGGTSFNVDDPAVTAIGSGQTPNPEGGAEACSWEAGKLTLCSSSAPAFTPATDGVCQVSADMALIGNPMGSGNLTNVAYGIAAEIEGTPTQVDKNEVITTPNSKGEQTVSRTRLVPVEAGAEYRFSTWLRSKGTSTGTSYWSMSFVCFG